MFGVKKGEAELNRSQVRQVMENLTQMQKVLLETHGQLFQVKTLASDAMMLSGSRREFDALVELINAAGLALTEVYVPVTEARARWEERLEQHQGGDGR
ncbi:hypothetical protein [Myceligenerans salitolerans]|uniref:Uncharacterized protein n=1 Tax=Myceligenerans salitolerans TaxID=1230528 RepID=A0ABS3I8U8_9MICO|nr:hypothetical protein [Myceligenerans salitolerans]MBO0609445.1 hypothetical protein [Myceligenerans salitolerans]